MAVDHYSADFVAWTKAQPEALPGRGADWTPGPQA